MPEFSPRRLNLGDLCGCVLASHKPFDLPSGSSATVDFVDLASYQWLLMMPLC